MTEYSYNGWPASPDGGSIGIAPFSVAGTVPFGSGGYAGGIKSGDVATVLGYVANNLHSRVEAMMSDPDTGQLGYGCWGYNYRANVNNPSSLSCHASGTAIDYNAPRHPNGSWGTFDDYQVSIIRDILAEVQGSVQWGGDYSGTVDEMHFEIIVNASDLAVVAATLPDSEDDMPYSEDDLKRIIKTAYQEMYRDDQFVELNNGEITTMRQQGKNIDQRTYTSEQWAINHP